MTLEKLCVKIEGFYPDIKRKDIYILFTKYLLVMIALGVFVGTAITSVTTLVPVLAIGILTVFGVTIVGMLSFTDSKELYDIFISKFKFWWLILIVEVGLTVVVAIFV